MLRPVKTRAKLTSNCPQSGDRNQGTPQPQVPSSKEHDMKNIDNDDGSTYKSLFQLMTHLWNVLTSTPL